MALTSKAWRDGIHVKPRPMFTKQRSAPMMIPETIRPGDCQSPSQTVSGNAALEAGRWLFDTPTLCRANAPWHLPVAGKLAAGFQLRNYFIRNELRFVDPRQFRAWLSVWTRSAELIISRKYWHQKRKSPPSERTMGFSFHRVGATRRLLNFLSPASRAGKRGCGGASTFFVLGCSVTEKRHRCRRITPRQ
jgi:hypothetical protein